MTFYENLFAIAPGMRALFRPDLATQGMRFMSTLATIADLIDAPESLGPELDDLARAHARVGVQAWHFEPMGAALLVTFGETLVRSSPAGCRRRGGPPTTISPPR